MKTKMTGLMMALILMALGVPCALEARDRAEKLPAPASQAPQEARGDASRTGTEPHRLDYAAREAASSDLESFRGGREVEVILFPTVVVVVVVVVLLILIL